MKKPLNIQQWLKAGKHTRSAAPDFNRDKLERTFNVERSSVDEKARTVELSFSSETEVKRWFGMEVLSHDPGAMRAERLSAGASLLVNHDWDDQVGVVESVRIDADRKGRAVVRFGNSARANEIFQDVKDGIRKLVSVGYKVNAAKLHETRDNGDDVYMITDWEPYEISIVSVPADLSVGVGRDAKPHKEPEPAAGNTKPILDPQQQRTQETPMNWKTWRNDAGDLVRQQVDANGAVFGAIEVVEKAGEGEQRGVTAERARVRALNEMATRYDAVDLARELIDNGGTAEQLQVKLLERLDKKTSKPVEEQRQNDKSIGLTDKEVNQYSLMRAIRAMLPNASEDDRKAAKFEMECSREAAKAYGKQARGIIIPDDVLSRAFNAGGAANTPTGATSGANLVDTQYMAGSFIDMLRKRTTIMQLGTTMGGLVGNVEIPKQTGGATAYWVGEGQDATEGTPTIGQLGLSPKTVAAYTDLTRRLMMQSTPDAEGIVWRDLAAAVAQAIDFAGYYGTGANNQPLGLKNYSGINVVDFATAGKPTFAELVQMETEIAADNADVNSMAYVFNAAMRGHAKTTAKFSGGADQGLIWEPGNTVNGYRTEVTNQLAAGDVFFANFADLIIGLWGGLDITVDPYSLSKSGGTRIVVFQDVDFALRRVESVCYGTLIP